MSKFIEKLKRAYLGPTHSIGFRKSPEAENPPVLLIASLMGANLAQAEAMAAEMDSAIVSSADVNAKDFGQLVKVIGDVPLGLLVESTDKGDIAKLIEFGSDFVVFDLKTPFEAVNKENMGKILKIERSLDQGLVKCIHGLPLVVDGVMVAGEEPLITIEALLTYQRVAELLDKPLLVTLGTLPTKGELQALYEAGVNGLVLPGGLAVEVFADLRKSMAELSATVKRRTRSAALLPRAGGELVVEAGGEEEEEI
ncbi:MAG TPA: hypothetical protein EYP71_03745 [Dehalococcoidia bacterium]|nr:hypothetical protein [Dehalococcoidia bacterium]